MIVTLMIIHILISAALILSILVQSSKGGALDGLVGSAATSALGGQGASKFMKQATGILAVLFTASCVIFAITLRDSKQGSSKVVDMLQKEAKKSTTEAQPVATPATLPAATETTE